jgi:DNA-binding transcriptional regulator YhcF (GntR family)
MSWTLQNDRPVYLQLIEQIKLRILSGVYPSGEHFPSVRELAAEAAVNPNTMQKALASLEQEGLLVSSRTSGRTVTTDQSLIRTLREESAEKNYRQFYLALVELGYTEDEIKDYIEKKREENYDSFRSKKH